MTQQPQQQYQYQPYMEPPAPQNTDQNTAGLVGFILGLVAFFMGGITSIPGLIFSIKGMKHPNNGFAIAGLILNIIGILIMLFWIAYIVFVFVFIFALAGAGMMAANNMTITTPVPAQVNNEPNMQRGQALVQKYFDVNLYELPDAAGYTLMAGDSITDSYGTPLRYETFLPATGGGYDHYRIISAGPDKAFDTFDDVTLEVDPHNPPTYTQPMPWITEAEVDLDALKKKAILNGTDTDEVPLNPLE